jgi:signal peptidase I
MFTGRTYFKKKAYGPILPSISAGNSNMERKIKNEDSNSSHSLQKGLYASADKDASELKMIEDSKTENGEIEIICNGIRFKGRPVEEVHIPSLICEECEQSLSSIKCEECNQVFCAHCYSLCHERSEAGAVLHPHEVEKMVRPIRIGDTSRVVVDKSFVMPNYEFYESDMLQIRALEIPNSLALSTYVDRPTDDPRKPTKYQRGDIVVYNHDVLKCEVYGKIESEWDFRNGDSAPSLIRGQGSGLVSYIVRCHGVVTPELLREMENEDDNISVESNNDGGISKLKIKAAATLKNLPVLEGVESMTLTSERVLAHKIDRRLNRAKYYRDYGPKNHLNPPVPKGFGGADGDDESLAGAVDEDSDTDSADDNETKNPTDVSKSEHSRLASQQLIRTTRPPTMEELRAKSLPHAIASRRSIDGVVAAYSYIAEVEATLSHQVYDISSEAPLLHRRTMISIQSEDSLIKPKDRLKIMQLRKKENIRRCLTKRFAAMFSNWLLWAFHLWYA